MFRQVKTERQCAKTHAYGGIFAGRSVRKQETVCHRVVTIARFVPARQRRT